MSEFADMESALIAFIFDEKEEHTKRKWVCMEQRGIEGKFVTL